MFLQSKNSIFKDHKKMERVMGFEPTTLTLARLHSSQLNYTRFP